MAKWRTARLGDEIDLLYGKALPASTRIAGHVPVFGSNGRVGVHNVAAVSGPGIIVGRKGSVGELAFSREPFWPIDTTYYVSNKGEHDWRFLYHLLSTLGLSKLNSHSAVPGLNREDVYSIEVAFPPRADEPRIAAALDEVDLAIARELKGLELAGALKRAAMRELFTRGLRGEPQKETEIGSIPESWELVPLEQYADAISKGSSPKWQGFDYVPDGVLFVRSQNVGDGILDLQDRVYLHPSWNAKERRSVLKAGDVLINLVGASIGRAALGDARIEGANCNQAVCFVRLREGGLLGAFVTGFLMSAGGQDQMHGSKKDVARANLSLEDVRGFRIPKPKMDEQQEIVAILDAIDRKIALHKEKRAVLEALFKSLLHKLMTGEVRVADLNLDALGRAAEAA